MTINKDIGVAFAVVGVEQLGRRCELDQGVGLLRFGLARTVVFRCPGLRAKV